MLGSRRRNNGSDLYLRKTSTYFSHLCCWRGGKTSVSQAVQEGESAEFSSDELEIVKLVARKGVIGIDKVATQIDGVRKLISQGSLVLAVSACPWGAEFYLRQATVGIAVRGNSRSIETEAGSE